MSNTEGQSKVRTFFGRYGVYGWMLLPYVIMELYLRIDLHKVRYFRGEMVFPSIAFSVLWAVTFLCIAIVLPRTAGRIVYAVLTLGTLAFFTANAISFNYTGYSFSFTLMKMADEGKGYLWEIVKSMGILLLLVIVLVLTATVWAVIKFPKKRLPVKRFAILMACFLVVHTLLPLCYGPAGDELHWDAWRNPRNVYGAYNDKNKSLKVSGLLEYTIRDFYLTFLKPEEKMSSEEREFLENAFSDQSMAEANAYTGICKGKNLIFLQLEGIDDWLVTPEVMPNLYGMMKESLNFSDHYAFYNGGGSTFNSEFAVNTGYITPVSYQRNAYTFNENSFPYSMPRQFLSMGYSVKAFHMNTEAFYSRGINYKNWGFDAYLSLRDSGEYDTKEGKVLRLLDRTMLMDETFRKELFATDHPTVSYLITYTPHTPFDTVTNEAGRYLAEELYGTAKPLSEEESIKLMAAETDRMVGMLLEGLKENGLLSKTVIVAYADHYLYTVEDKSILERNKPYTKDNRINRTPLFIWGTGCDACEIDKANSQLDILPTVLNLFSIPYGKSWYIGGDILAPDFSGEVFFPDASIYNGTVYVENGTVTDGAEISDEELKELQKRVNERIRKNDLALKYDWFGRE